MVNSKRWQPFIKSVLHGQVQRAHPRELAQAQLISRTVRRHFATNLHVRSPLVNSARHKDTLQCNGRRAQQAKKKRAANQKDKRISEVPDMQCGQKALNARSVA